MQHQQLRHSLATNVRKARIEAGLSQEELGSVAGLHRTYVGSIERAERNVSLATVERLGKALGVDPVILLQPPADNDR